MKMSKKIIAVAIAGALLFTGAALKYTPVVQAVTQSEIDELKGQADDISGQIDGLQADIDALASDKTQTLEKKALYDEQCALIEEQITNTQAQIDEYNGLIEQAQKELEAAEKAEEEQYELMCTRLRSMEENGSVSYWEVIFAATSFTDMLSRIDLVSSVAANDEEIIDEYQQLQKETQARKDELTEYLGEAEDAKEELEAQKGELEAKLQEAIQIIKDIESDQAAYQAKLDQLAQAENDLLAEISAKEEELKNQYVPPADNGGSTGGGSTGGGPVSDYGFIWPVGGYDDITSFFGYRSPESTGGIGTTFHQGIDIANVGYTTPIAAAAGGTVTAARYNSSMGNYVTISHGNGVSTVYMHMSYSTVSVGQTVSQGQTIGITGSTGDSTGPHLHFSVVVNGVYVDPLDYLP